MKNLLKITMSLAMVLLISTSVFAIDPPTAPNINGSVSLEVQSFLNFTLTNPALVFTYNHETASAPLTQATTVVVGSNIDWTASVVRTDNPLPTGVTLQVSTDGTSYINMPVINDPLSVNGSMINDVVFNYDFVFTGNPLPDTYLTHLTYSVTAR